MRWDISSLKFMYNMERFAIQIYLTQRRVFNEESMLKKLNAAAENEQEHVLTLGSCSRRLPGYLAL
jgi:rubrerythrin